MIISCLFTAELLEKLCNVCIAGSGTVHKCGNPDYLNVFAVNSFYLRDKGVYFCSVFILCEVFGSAVIVGVEGDNNEVRLSLGCVFFC